MESSNSNTQFSLRQVAMLVGAAILTMAVFAGFSYGFALNRLVVATDTQATADNIRNSEVLFRSCIFGFLVVLVCDVLTAWGLHVFMRKVNPDLSLLTAWLRLVYSGLLGVALLNFALILSLSGRPDLVESNALISLLLETFGFTWSIGLVVFGLHLLLLGYLVFVSGYVPRIIGTLLIVASICYVSTNLANLLLPGYKEYRSMVDLALGLPMALGELALGLWLVIRGGKSGQPHFAMFRAAAET